MSSNDFPDPVERGYWADRPPPVPRIGDMPTMDVPIPIVPTNRKIPPSAPSKHQVVVNANEPPWNKPPFWAIPYDVVQCACIPFALKEAAVFNFKVPDDRMLIISHLSYEIHNIDQYQSFSIRVMDSGMTRLSIEDMLIDPLSANPAHRYAFAGHTRPMPVHTFVDHNHVLTITATFLGTLDFAGNSDQQQDAILTPNPEICVNVIGWLANVRDSRDGAPRPTDLGDLLNIPLRDDWTYGGYSGWR